MFKKVATLQFKKIYASDASGNYYWRDFVKQANTQLATDSNFVPKNFYEYDTKNFLYITARAISGMEKWGCNGNFDAFPWKELKSSYPTFCGKGFYIEHKEDNEMDAKGIILDAQPDDENEFINCICAISKEEYPDICEQILNGQLNQVSMSCLAAECECSKCHNVATKEEELCEHMNPKHPNFCKGSLDGDKPIYEINRNIVFTGLSGVAIPADKDAFIFDVKAGKKENGKTINKEYNKYCRAKKEYEYINSLLEKEDTRKYIESQLKKEASPNIKGKDYKELLDNIKKSGYEFDEHYYDEEYDDIKVYKDGKEYIIEVWVEDYEAPDSYSIIKIKDTGKTYKDLGEFLVNSSLKKKASKTLEEIAVLIDKVWDDFDHYEYADQLEVGEKSHYDNILADLQKDEKGTISKFINMIKEDINGFESKEFDEISKYYNDKFKKIKANLKKKADVEYMSDTIKEIPPIDFITEFMEAGKSKGINIDINKEQLEMGKKVEMEHTTNPVIAEKIAMDHIKEIPNYYTLLAEMEEKAKTQTEVARQIINKENNEEPPVKLGSKQFFKIKKVSKQWFKIASIYDDPEDRNDIDKYGLTQLERETLADVVWDINRVNEESYITWEELIESIPADIISIEKINKNKDKIIDFIQNELKQDIEIY